MKILIRGPEVVLKQDCPIAWPADPVPAASASTDPMTAQAGWIRLRYDQTVYLPEVSLWTSGVRSRVKDAYQVILSQQLAPFEQLARDLQRMSLPKPASASGTASNSTNSPVSELLLTLPEIESKHRRRLSGPIESFVRRSGADTERDLGLRIGPDGDFPDDGERRTWMEGMGYRADSGILNMKEGDHNEREIIKIRKRMTDEFERRE